MTNKEAADFISQVKKELRPSKRKYNYKPTVLLFPMSFYELVKDVEYWKQFYINTVKETGDPNVEIYFFNGLYPEEDKYILQKDGALKKVTGGGDE